MTVPRWPRAAYSMMMFSLPSLSAGAGGFRAGFGGSKNVSLPQLSPALSFRPFAVRRVTPPAERLRRAQRQTSERKGAAQQRGRRPRAGRPALPRHAPMKES